MKQPFPYFFVAVLVLVSAALTAVVVLRSATSSPATPGAQRESYQVSTRHIVADYERVAAADPKRAPTFAATAEAKLLNLTVPAEDRSIHLDLVLAFHALSDTTSSAKRAEGNAKLTALLAANAWLR